MQKIKFKIEYKPLSDAAINRHKNFDGLMAMYLTAPKPNFFQKLFKGKWTMFSGGIIIGSAITALIMMQEPAVNHTQQSISEIRSTNSIQAIEQENPVSDKGEEFIPGNMEVENIIPAKNQNASTNEIRDAEPKVDASVMLEPATTPDSYTASVQEGESNDAGMRLIQNEELQGLNNNQQVAVNSIDNIISGESVPEPENKSTPWQLLEDDNETTDPDTEPVVETAVNTDQQNMRDVELFELPVENAIAGNDETVHTEVIPQQAEKVSKEKRQPRVKEPKSADTVQFAFLNKLFNKPLVEDTPVTDEITVDENIPASTEKTDAYTNRYAQLSLFTPMGTNGIDSYKFSQHLSINMIAGFNGAVNGLEVGGVANIDRGYVNGGQFAGVVNAIGDDLKGMQGAGVANYAGSVNGFQAAGVVNVSSGSVNGMQAAGVMNIAVKKMNGFQAAGVINLNTSLESSLLWQAAGVVNFSLAHATGAQTAGVLNISNDLTGAQIGLVNVSKKITGVQIGLVNIADTIDGVAIGLLSVSRNGIFDIDISTNEMFPVNAAVRVGGPYIYNIFTFGTSISADTTSFGYGLGLGGHIPYQKFFLDIDAVAWNVHRDKFEFNYDNLQMNNQLRIMPGYTINKFIQVYAGPVLNVEVYDNESTPVHNNTFQTFGGNSTNTSFSIGYVAGLRFF